jgi:hypothetical protein
MSNKAPRNLTDLVDDANNVLPASPRYPLAMPEIPEIPVKPVKPVKQAYLKFSDRITPENRLALDRMAYWNNGEDAKLVNIFNKALAFYFATQENAQKRMPSEQAPLTI